jgi:hypothetical protein
MKLIKKINIFVLLISFSIVFGSLNLQQPNLLNEVNESQNNDLFRVNNKLNAPRPGMFIDFETAPSLGVLNNYATYLNFSPSFARYDVSGSVTLIPYSGSWAIESNSAPAWINFTLPQQYVEFFFLYNNSTPYIITAYNHLGGVLTSITVSTPGIPYTNVSIAFNDIVAVQISGTAFQYNIEDLYFENDTMAGPMNPGKYLDFEIAPPSNKMSNYVPYLEFDVNWYRYLASLEPILKPSNGSYVARTNGTANWLNFTVPQKVVNFQFIFATPGDTYDITAYNSTGAKVDQFTNSTSNYYHNVTLLGKDIRSVIIVGSSIGWELNFVIDQLYFENDTILTHSILQPVIQNPLINSTVSGNVTVSYLSAVDSLGHTINYNITLTNVSNSLQVYYLQSWFSGTVFSFNSVSYPNGIYYLKVKGFDSSNFFNDSQIVIIISNSAHSLSLPSFYLPINNSYYSGIQVFNWSTPVDSSGHTVRFNLTMRLENLSFTSYPLLVNTTQDNYYLNTSIYVNNYYSLSVTSFDSYGLENNIKVFFYIDNPIDPNHTLSTPTFYYPTNYGTYSDFLNVSWSPAIDSLGHTVQYNLTMTMQFSPYTKYFLSWFSTQTYFMLNTTGFSDDLYYLTLTSYEGFGLVRTSVVYIYTNNTNSLSHTITTPTFSKPIEGNTYNKTLNITWTPAIDSNSSHSIQYNLTMTMQSTPFTIYYLAIFSSQTFYVLNTSLYPDSYYILNLTSYDFIGFSSVASLNFMINNTDPTPHTLSVPSFSNPIHNNQYSGYLNITWSPAEDSYSHFIEYNLTLTMVNSPYTSYPINYWFSDEFYYFNTSDYADNYYYLSLMARDGQGLYNTTLVYFYINNSVSEPIHSLLPPNIQNTNNSVVSGPYNVTWLESVDSLDHYVSYNVSLRNASTNDFIGYLAQWTTLRYIEINNTFMPEGNYTLVVESDDSYGLHQQSVFYFSIFVESPPQHKISNFILNSPTNNSVQSGIVTLLFSQAQDSLNHDVKYEIWIFNQNNSFLVVNKTIDVLFYDFDTTSVPNGEYLIQIRASDGLGVYSEFTAVIFTIKNDNSNTNPSSNIPTTSTSPNNQTSNTSPSIITATPSFELIYPLIVFGLIGLFYKRRKF